MPSVVSPSTSAEGQMSVVHHVVHWVDQQLLAVINAWPDIDETKTREYERWNQELDDALEEESRKAIAAIKNKKAEKPQIKVKHTLLRDLLLERRQLVAQDRFYYAAAEARFQQLGCVLHAILAVMQSLLAAAGDNDVPADAKEYLEKKLTAITKMAKTVSEHARNTKNVLSFTNLDHRNVIRKLTTRHQTSVNAVLLAPPPSPAAGAKGKTKTAAAAPPPQVQQSETNKLLNITLPPSGTKLAVRPIGGEEFGVFAKADITRGSAFFKDSKEEPGSLVFWESEVQKRFAITGAMKKEEVDQVIKNRKLYRLYYLGTVSLLPIEGTIDDDRIFEFRTEEKEVKSGATVTLSYWVDGAGVPEQQDTFSATWTSRINHRWRLPFDANFLMLDEKYKVLAPYFANAEFSEEGELLPLRTIKKDEEITIDYGYGFWAERTAVQGKKLMIWHVDSAEHRELLYSFMRNNSLIPNGAALLDEWLAVSEIRILAKAAQTATTAVGVDEGDTEPEEFLL